MRTNMTLILAGIAVLAFVGGCNGTEQQASGSGAGDNASGVSPTAQTRTSQPATMEGEVLETMNSGGYTYVLVNTGDAQNWYAGLATQVAVGDTVIVPKNAMEMPNFESPTLGRTFDVIYFVNSIRKSGGAPTAPAVSNPHGGAPVAATPDIDMAGITKAEGGVTVADLFKTGAAGAGREVTLRGKVVKFNADIMGKNWLHVRDGTGDQWSNDITITTQGTASVGDIVLVKGKLAADRDFGYGYKYPLLIEDATVTVE